MRAAEIIKKVQRIGIPVARNAFEGTVDDPVPELPYIVYLQPHGRGRGSDSKILLIEEDLDIELYTEKDDEKTDIIRKQIEAEVLADVEHEKFIAYIEEEECFQTAYEIRSLLSKVKGEI